MKIYENLTRFTPNHASFRGQGGTHGRAYSTEYCSNRNGKLSDHICVPEGSTALAGSWRVEPQSLTILIGWDHPPLHQPFK